MKARVAAAAVLALLTTNVSSAFATVRISDDHGGQIGDYLNKYHALRETGDRVEIDGTCASACTMLLGVIPRNRICVTPRAVLAFHSAWTPTSEGEQISNAGNYYLWSNYPANCAQVDHRARRIAFTNYLSQRSGIGCDVSGLSLIGEELPRTSRRRQMLSSLRIFSQDRDGIVAE